MNQHKIYLSVPDMGDKELEFINDAFKSNWIAPCGENVDEFENGLQSYTGISYACALNTGTAAIHMALVLLGVNKGDVVICQSFTYCATANPILYQGAIPVFIDSEYDTWNMNPEFLETAIKSCLSGKITGSCTMPKAIIVVDGYGMPANFEQLTKIADYFNIPLIEDAAEALGSSINTKKCGTFGKLGILSFNGNKIITTSSGGALLSNDKEMICRARYLASQARDNEVYYEHSQIGYNYLISNVSAGIGRGQLQLLDAHVKSRREIFARYKDYFTKINQKGFNVVMPDEPEGYISNRWLTTILIDPKINKGISRDNLISRFADNNIETRPFWKPMHLQPLYTRYSYFGNGLSEMLHLNGVCLPSSSNMNDDDWRRIHAVLDQVFS